MDSCDVCGKDVQETFLGKILGTIIRDASGKRKVSCFECQKKLRTKEEILKNLK